MTHALSPRHAGATPHPTTALEQAGNLDGEHAPVRSAARSTPWRPGPRRRNFALGRLESSLLALVIVASVAMGPAPPANRRTARFRTLPRAPCRSLSRKPPSMHSWAPAASRMSTTPESPGRRQLLPGRSQRQRPAPEDRGYGRRAPVFRRGPRHCPLRIPGHPKTLRDPLPLRRNLGPSASLTIGLVIHQCRTAHRHGCCGQRGRRSASQPQP